MNEKIHRPKGIFPSLPSGMDLVIKKYFDTYRKAGELPPEVIGSVEGKLFDDTTLLEQWRNWRTGLRWTDGETGATLSGALDDCVVDDGRYIPLDYKTRGADPREDTHTYYQHQLDCYELLLSENGYTTAGLAYLVYYVPDEVRPEGIVQFRVSAEAIPTEKENARKLVRAAATCLAAPLPKHHSTCTYCSFGKEVNDFA